MSRVATDSQHPAALMSRTRTGRRLPPATTLALAVGLLAVVAVASLAIGTRQMPLDLVLGAFTSLVPGDADQLVVRELRLPRAVVGIMAGAALGVVAALLQGATRNPLADPGLLGINAGASLAVVAAIAFLGVASPFGFIWFAFAGAALAAAVVFAIGSTGASGASPAKLALTGAAVTAATTPLVTLLLIRDDGTLLQFRFWSVGSLSGRGLESAAVLWPFLIAGLVLAAWLAGRLNLLALGDDVARGLGVRLGTTRVVTAIAVIVLAGTATSLAGPIALLGLAVAHAARGLVGGDYRWVTPLAAVLGAVVLLAADVIGRVVVAPAELEAGIVAAIVGAPVLIALVRRTKGGGL
ncbi:iron ABC transporter permease [Agromyces albus]|uniref:Iron ABC transporter permease n=2 Tax=Agromyces albus TaxID=205332 RepID=A0A4Q2KUH6_9MICO|nr:iron ABC transporter permease [Agromyces albus]